MENDLKQLQNMINDYVDGNIPLPVAFIFTALTPCRHGDGERYDYEHALASQEDEEGEEAFELLTGYTIAACNEYLPNN